MPSWGIMRPVFSHVSQDQSKLVGTRRPGAAFSATCMAASMTVVPIPSPGIRAILWDIWASKVGQDYFATSGEMGRA